MTISIDQELIDVGCRLHGSDCPIAELLVDFSDPAFERGQLAAAIADRYGIVDESRDAAR